MDQRAPARGRLPGDVRRLVDRYRFRVRALALFGGLGLTLAVASLSFAAALVLDRYFVLETSARIALTAGSCALTALAALTALIARAVRPLRPREVARRIEAAHPELAGSLLSLVELASGPACDREACSPELLESLGERTARAACRIDVAPLVPARGAAAAVLLGACGLAALTAFAAADLDGFRQLAARYFRPREDLPRPTTVALEVVPSRRTVARGARVELDVEVLRGEPREVWILTRMAGGAPERPWATTRLAPPDPDGTLRPGDRLRHAISDLEDDIELRVRAGDFLGPLERLTVRDPPRPIAFHVTYRYPAYAGRKPQAIVKASGDLAALAGTRADLRVDASGEVRWASLHLAGNAALSPSELGGKTVSFRAIPIDADGEYDLELAGEDGVSSPRGFRYSVRALPDAPPRVEVLTPRAAEVEIETAGTLEVRFRAEDDVGVAAIELAIGKGESARTIALYDEPEPARRERLRDGVHLLGLAGLGLAPGETIAAVLRVRDGLGRAASSSERRLRAAYPPEPPEGREWLERLGGLRRGLRELESAWEACGVGAAGALERALAARIAAVRLGESARQLGRGLAAASPNGAALEGLHFALGELADGDAAAYWEAEASAAGSSEAGSPASAAAEAHRRAGARLAEIAAQLEALVLAEELEEAHEVLRLLVHDSRALAAELSRESAGDRPPTVPGERIPRLGAEALRIAARLSRLAEGEGALRSPRAADLGALSRAVIASLGEELADARSAAAEGKADEAATALARAAQAGENRRLDLERAWTASRAEARAARRTLAPRLEVAAEIARLAESFASERADAARLAAARRAIAALEFLAAAAEAPERSDFESAALLDAVRELLERSLEEDLEERRLPPDERLRQRASRARFLEELAGAYRRLEPALALGRLAQSLAAAAAEEESLAWRLRSADAAHVRLAGAARRAQEDSIELLASCEVADAATAQHVELALAAAREARDALVLVPPDPAAATRALVDAARELDAAVAAAEAARALALEAARTAAEWLRGRRGTIPERLLRFASSLETAAQDLRADTARDPQEGPAKPAEERTARALAAADDGVRNARELAGDLRREASRLVAAQARSESIQALDRAAGRLLAVAAGELGRSASDVRAALTAEGAERSRYLASAAATLEAAAARVRAIAAALSLLGDDDLAALGGEELAELLADAAVAAGGEGEPRDPALIARRARRLLEVCSRALSALGGRLRDSIEKRELIDRLASAADHLRAAVEQADAGDSRGGAESLRAGLAQLGAAVALARKLRGEAEGALEATAPAQDSPAPEADAARGELAAALEATRQELAKLLELHALEKEAGALLEELLREGSDAEKLAAAAQAEDEIAQRLAESVLDEARLLEVVARLVAIDSQGREVAEDERYLEEEARKVLAAGESAAARSRLRAELAPEQRRIAAGAEQLVADFRQAGLRLSALVADVFTAFLKTSAAAQPLLDRVEDARRELERERADEATVALAAANLELGTFLAGVGDTRRRALEAIAQAKDASDLSANAALARAIRSSQDAARLLRQGALGEAMRRHSALRHELLAAGRTLRRGLEGMALPSGPEGPLLSRLLEEEAARHGLVWTVGTRGERFEGEQEAPGIEDMPFPPAYRELVRIYLRAISARR